VKSIDAPKLTVLRPDNVTQTLELNEETSLRRGRESITMADVQVGDHVVVREASRQYVRFQNVMVLSPEQWEAHAGNGRDSRRFCGNWTCCPAKRQTASA